MNNGLPGPSTTDTITGGKTLELSEYDKVRKPHKAITDGTEIKINARSLSSELCCPICLDLLKNTMTTKECLHRFCDECITTALMRGNKECPTCRKKIVSKRSLRPDPNFDNIINAIWPDRRLYEEMQEESMRLFNEQNNVKALQKSIEDGMKAQAANRRQRVQGSYDYEKKRRRPKFAGDASQSGGPTTSGNAAGSGDASGAADPSADNDPADASAPNVDVDGSSTGGGVAAASGRRTMTHCRSTSSEATNETETALLSEECSSADDDDDETTNSHVEESSDDEDASNTAMEVDEPVASRLTASHSSGGSSSLARHRSHHQHNAKPARVRKANGGGASTSSAVNASAAAGGLRGQSGVKPPSSQCTLK